MNGQSILILAMPIISLIIIGLGTWQIIRTTSKHDKAKFRQMDKANKNLYSDRITEINEMDLLPREPIQVNLKEIGEYLTDKTILVTGAGGSIGSEICRQICSVKPRKLILLGHGENSIFSIENELIKRFSNIPLETMIGDIQDRKKMEDLFESFRPSLVFHAAAHKHVPLMEKNPMEAIKNNVFGTKNVAECAHQFGVEKFVLISSDKAVNPTSIMGITKCLAEIIIQSLNQVSKTSFTAVRFGNVLGSRGSVLPLFKQQIKEGGPVTITHPEMIRYFLTIPEAVQLVIQAGSISDGGEVFILDMGKPVKIKDLAYDLIRLSGLEPEKDIDILYTGIRPGEKLVEEMFTINEQASVTKHDRIFICHSPLVSSQNFMLKLLHLEEAIYHKSSFMSPKEIKDLIRGIFPNLYFEITKESGEK